MEKPVMIDAKRHRRDGFKPKLIAMSVAACLGVPAQQALANPTGGTVVSGGASFASSGSTLTVTNTANAIINWQSFSIGVNEITRFLQSSASSAVLNRVVGAGGAIPRSVIDGVLSSNGRVFLLNSSGIVIGANARIDVAGFVASSLNLSDQDFLNGRMHFTEVPGAGDISNAGVIQAASGGRVFLVAPNVENSGAISAPQGQIVLAAGKSVDLVSENSPFVTVRVTADTEHALNLGSLIAESGRIDMSGALVRQAGLASANSASVGANGEIRLVATNSVTLDAGSVTSASGGAQGGNIQVSAPVVVQVGDVRADGNAGGKIQVDANNFLQAGTLSASGSAGAGGEIGVNAAHVIQTSAAVMAADGSGGDGGSISVDASGALDGLLFSSARYSATGDRGGNIKLLGHDIVLLGANADASGTNGGGTILVGGDFQGNNPAVPNAVTTGINFSTTLKADATQTGDGGKIVVWSNTNTQFYGTASARGGAQSGNGGFMEISTGENLTMGGFADAGAPNGTAGTLLLDPKNIIIDSNVGASGTLGSFQLLDPNPGANEGFGSQVVVLPSQNVVVTDPNDSFGGGAVGAGAVYLFNSTTGALMSALTGSSLNDHVGSGAITVLPSGNYLLQSPGWSNGSATGAGAMTFGNGTSGVSGLVSASNSLVGTTANDAVGSGGVGGVEVLTNGNYVVMSPNWNNVNAAAPGAGAATFGSGATGVVGAVSVTNSLVGTTTADQVGLNVAPLNNGTYVVLSPRWNNGAATQAGAVTFGGASGVVGTVSATNSLVGTTLNDEVGVFGVTLLGNGNYVVDSAFWNNGTTATSVGAVTLVGSNGNIVATGTPGGAVSLTNSLVGTTAGDNVGDGGIIPLFNGNYVVGSPFWNNAGAALAGAVTLVNGSTGNIAGTLTPGGAVSATNSLVGTTANDFVGVVTPLINGNYLVSSPNWNNVNAAAPGAGAVTFVNGSNGFIGATGTPGGAISATNSLVGGTAGDSVGGSFGVTPLLGSNGNYLVISPSWDIPAGAGPAVANVGAVTFGSGTTGVSGLITAGNSLIGTTTLDAVGINGVTLLTNGNYVVNSPNWNNGAATLAGAVTFGNGTSGTVGAVSAANSLVGTTANDSVGSFGVIPLFINGNYVVSSPGWSNGPTAGVGAVTFVNGSNGFIGATGTPGGAVSAANSLVGTTAGDGVGNGRVTALINGNYVVMSPFWSNGLVAAAGAVTLVNGSTGNIAVTGTPGGTVSAANSLVGTTTNDRVGIGGVAPLFINGNYVVSSPNWNGGAGAVTFGNGTTGITGQVTSSNSLVGGTPDNSTSGAPGDRVGSGNIVELFGSGNYLVVNLQWNNPVTGATRAGAVTWVNGTNGNVFGQASPGAVISASNSLVGGSLNDGLGLNNISCDCNQLRGIVQLPNGNFVVVNPQWTNAGSAGAGAVTFGSGTTGIAGLVSPTNSLVGSSLNENLGADGIFPLTNGNFVVPSTNATNGILPFAGLVYVATPGTGSTVTSPATGQTFASNPSGDVTITPAAITAITNGGTNLVLQANNDITLNAGSNIVTSAGGAGGAITLQAGRSIVLNSNITTDSGAVTLVANELAANGVVDANRDAGAAVIAMAPGTAINAGNANISLTLNSGAGLTNSTSGNITLASLTTTGQVLVQNLGPTAGSGISLAGTVSAAAGTVLISGGDISNSVSGSYAVQGGAVALTAAGAIGSPAAPLALGTASLAANAANGIAITLNSLSPAPAVVSALNNTTIGDIVLNAYGGATFTSLVSNPGGNVSITTFSPLDVNAGINAGNSIFLTTSGASGTNDMSLAGPFTHGTTGAFEVTIGLLGQLTLPINAQPTVLTSASPLPSANDPNITKFTFVVAQGQTPEFEQNTVTYGINQSTTFGSGEHGKNDKDDEKKGLAVCK